MAEEAIALDIDCSTYQVQEVSYSPTPMMDSGVFACSIGGLTDDAIAELTKAMHERVPVRLLVDGHSLLLQLALLQRKDTDRVDLLGFVDKPGRRRPP